MDTTAGHRLGQYLRAAAHMTASRLATRRPFFVSHMLTARCFGKCPYCLWRGDSPEQADTGEVIAFYRRARRAVTCRARRTPGPFVRTQSCSLWSHLLR